MIASVDCLVSLYRSEGFGLTVAEAMLLRTAVVATDWSAPVEFCAGGAMLVPGRLVPVRDRSGTYEVSGAVWAEPDIAQAGAAMRSLYDDPAQRRSLVDRAEALARERLATIIPSEGYERFLRST